MKHLFASRDGDCRGTHLKRAFTLVEIMIAITLMSVIVLGLMAMFSQTQRAFRLGMNQTDVLEGGRIATDMIVREMEQMMPTYKTNMLTASMAVPSFYADLLDTENSGLQLLPGGGFRTNVLSEVFFVMRQNQVWTGLGYFVRTNARVPGAYGPVGTLYRYETNNSVSQFDYYPRGFMDGFNAARFNGVLTNVSKVLEGVVHFQVRAFDTNGVQILPYSLPRNRILETGTNISGFAFTTAVPGAYAYWMPSNAVPAFVELEIGILEQQTYERYKNIPVMQRQRDYYTNHAANVHLFRQRIPVRKVDLAAYK